MRDTEILAPVGGWAQLYAAVRCGADAVYFGAQGFNARQNAENFDDSSLGEAVSYCHARGVRVHITVNTLVMDGELPALLKTIETIAGSGADAVIIQDLAVLQLFKEHCPDIQRHASTQMTVHNIQGARMMQKLGFHRVVLARELTLAEIRAINEAVEIETEVFIHGAHCMSVSGACYLSAMLGGRSGNRGLCAQPCRLNFQYGEQEYALSLKDLSFIPHVHALIEAGTCSFKIEGRMKRPEYVAAAVTACRDMLAGRQPDMQRLQAVFSRSGFTDGYLTGRRTTEMFGHRSREDVTAAAGVLGELAALYQAETPRLPVDMELELRGGGSRLTLSCGAQRLCVEGALPQTAITSPTTQESAKRSLEKCGGTPFYLRQFAFLAEDNLMLPVSALNALRREGLTALLNMLGEAKPHAFRDMPLAEEPPYSPANPPALWGRFESAAQIPENSAALAKIILPISALAENPALLTAYSGRIIAELPALLFPGEEAALAQTLGTLREAGLREALTDNIYGISLAADCGLTARGGFGLNICNTTAIRAYAALGCASVTLSFELSMQKIRQLGAGLPRGILAYGYLPLMRMRACPAGSGCDGCGGSTALTDRRGIRFPLKCEGRRFTTLYNSLPLYIADRDIRGADYLLLYFTSEDSAACGDMIDAFREKRPAGFPRTGGLYYRKLQ